MRARRDAVVDDRCALKSTREQDGVSSFRSSGRDAMTVAIVPAGTIDGAVTAATPVALIGRDGRVLGLNDSFEKLVGDGLQLKQGRLASAWLDADRGLGAAISLAVSGGVSPGKLLDPVVLPREVGRRPIIARILPIETAHAGRPEIVAIVTLTDLEAPHAYPDEALLRAAFGLTPAEARLAAQIAVGRTLREISEIESRARETLRTTLKSLFGKLRVSRQSEIALLLSKVAHTTPVLTAVSLGEAKPSLFGREPP